MAKEDPFKMYDARPVRDSEVSRRDRDIDVIPGGGPGGARTLGTPSSLFNLRLWAGVMVLVLILLFSRIFFLQIVEGGQFRITAEGNRTYAETTKALRGVMYDVSGEVLVKNVPNFRLTVDGSQMPSRRVEEYDQIVGKIVELSGLSVTELTEIIFSSRVSGHREVIGVDIPYEDALQLMIDSSSVSQLAVEAHYKREYLRGPSLSHVIGYTGKLTEEEAAAAEYDRYLLSDELGKTGVEASYESTLRGEDGVRIVEVDSQGREQSIISETVPASGNNIHLEIDAELQSYLFDELARVVEDRDLSGASAVAIDPRDGAVRALVSYPSYDNNDFSGGVKGEVYNSLLEDERNPLFNRPVSGLYPSGSTFKPVVAAAGLDEGIITEGTAVNSVGGITIDQYTYPDWKAGGHGITNVTKALADSVNTFFYLLGGGDNETSTGLGVDRIVAYARLFGLGSQTGIDVPGEASGFLPSQKWKEEAKDEPWYLGDTYILSIGQGDILVTPLQIALMTAVFANGGDLYTPHVVSHTTDKNGSVTREVRSPVEEQVVSPSAVSIVRKGLREAVEYGSAKSLQSLPVSSGGKTGTAQFGNEDKTHSWFTSFAPFDEPEIVLTVLVEEGGGGNDAALPIAREALRFYFNKKGE